MSEHDETADPLADDRLAESVHEQEVREHAERPTIRLHNRTLNLVILVVLIAMFLSFASTVVIWTSRSDYQARAEQAEQDRDAARAEAQAARLEQQCRSEYNVEVVSTRAEVDFATAARDVAQDALVAALGGVAPAGSPPLDVGQAFANLTAASEQVSLALDHYSTAVDEYRAAVEGTCSETTPG